MEKQIKRFLEFNGKTIYFLAVDGTYWIAIKPICEALGVDYVAQFKRLKDHPILGQLLSDQTMVGADNRLRKMSSLPEKFIYGWLFGIQSSSPDLIAYQYKCYDVLYDYFHGSLVDRQTVLKEKSKLQVEIEALERKVAENVDFQKLQELKGKQSQANRSLKQLDNKIISAQLDLWRQEIPA